MTGTHFLSGQLLIAMPGMSDPRFDKSVIYMCAHSEQGAMGLIVNKTAPLMRFGDLLAQLDLLPHTPPDHAPDILAMPVLYGGPVEPERGFVLHSSDYLSEEASLPVSDSIAITATVDILRDLAVGKGPTRALLALGYSGWAPGQIEDEIQRNGWLTCEADDEIIFRLDFAARYVAALRKLKIDPAMLSTESGRA